MTGTDYLESSSRWAADHVRRYLASDGADGYEFMHGATVIILTTTGARTGKPRKTPLIRVRDGDRYLLVASQGGAPKHPHWYLNLVANPDVTIQDRADVHEMRARTASADEKAQLWPTVVATWPEYDEYQAKTTRDIPLVICEPR